MILTKVTVADEFVDMARGAPTKEALADALNECFPDAARLESASKHLRDLFYTACPQFEWEVRSPRRVKLQLLPMNWFGWQQCM